MTAIPKPKRERSESRLAWAKTQGCLVAGRENTVTDPPLRHRCNGPVDAHHVRYSGGLGTKPSDYDTVALCRTAHDLFHLIGRDAFEARYDISFRDILADYAVRYLMYNREHPQRPSKVREPHGQLCWKCSCKGIHPVRGGRYYCTRTRKYSEVA